MERRTAVRAAEAELPTRHGTFRILVYRDVPTGKEHAALVRGLFLQSPGEDDGDGAGDNAGDAVLVRVHSECLTGDIFQSLRCDCGAQLAQSLERIDAAGRGVLLYLRQEGRDIGLTQKIRAYELQQDGMDTFEANVALGHPEDARTYEAAHDILADLGINRIRLLTNNPGKIDALQALGVTVVERVPLVIPANDVNRDYLATKRAKMGHFIDEA